MNPFRMSRGVVVMVALSAAASAQTIQVNKENRTIAITATDKVTAMADQATVHIGFIAYGPDSNTAYANGSRLSNAIVKALTASGIAKETIQSESQQLQPVQNYQLDKLTEAQKAQRQFQVSQSWTVKTAADDAEPVGADRLGIQGRERSGGAGRGKGAEAGAGAGGGDGFGIECEAGSAAVCEQRGAGGASSSDVCESGSCTDADG
jgi:hypothetical protein